MRKINLLFFCTFCLLLLTWCEKYNNFTTYEQKTAWCEKWVLSHWNTKAVFKWNGSEKTWNKIIINWIKDEWKSKQVIKCEFNENWKLLWVEYLTLTN